MTLPIRPSARAIAAVLAGVLAACQAPARLADVRPSAGPGARPRPVATATADATPAADMAPVARLAAPAAGARVLRGQVRLDAAYVVGTGAGRVVGTGAAAAVALAGAPVVPGGGAPAVAPFRLADDGQALVGPEGLTLVADGGGGLVANHGAGVIANNGAGVIANHGAGFRLRQLGPAPAAGTVLPAAGMVVAAVALATGAPAPLGRDAAGRDVYAVYTDEAGAYTLHLPAELRGNMRVVALAPAGRDARLGLGALAEPTRAASREVSEVADDAADYVRFCFASQLDGLLDPARVTRIEALLAAGDMGLDPREARAARAGIGRLEALARRAGYAEMPTATREALVGRLTAVALADMPLAEVRTTTGRPALEAFEATLARAMATTAGLMASPPPGKTAESLFDAIPSFAAAGFRVRRPSDVNDFLVRGMLAKDPLDVAAFATALAETRAALGLPPLPPEEDAELGEVSMAVGLAIGRHMFQVAEGGAMPIVDALDAAAAAWRGSKP